MKPENTLGSPYADLLPASSVEALNKLAQELDDMYTAPQKPAGLSWTNALQYRSLLLSRPKPRLELPAQALPGLLRTKSQLKKSFPALAALIMAVLLGTGLLNPTLWQSLQATPGIATLHSQVNALLLSQLLQITIPVRKDAAHFHLTVPFYAGKVVNINQTVTWNGKSITLERAVIAPSGTRFYFTSAGQMLVGPEMLSVAGKTYYVRSGNLGKPLPDKQGEFNFWDSLQNATGTWTVKIETFVLPDVVAGTPIAQDGNVVVERIPNTDPTPEHLWQFIFTVS